MPIDDLTDVGYKTIFPWTKFPGKCCQGFREMMSQIWEILSGTKIGHDNFSHLGNFVKDNFVNTPIATKTTHFPSLPIGKELKKIIKKII